MAITNFLVVRVPAWIFKTGRMLDVNLFLGRLTVGGIKDTIGKQVVLKFNLHFGLVFCLEVEVISIKLSLSLCWYLQREYF